jgi:hypothetical protein
MAKIQLDIPEELNKELAIKKIQMGLKTKKEVVLALLEEVLLPKRAK